jgi:prepilin-type N-terminal cleavage/methylation domain-containing protein
MRGEGFSLVEMMVVICIISILLAIATLRFDVYAKRNGSESQTRTLYITLLKAQSDAVYQRRGTRITLYPRHFEIYSSLAEGAAPRSSQNLSYPITWNNRHIGSNIEFDRKGIPTTLRSVCVDSGDDTGAVDSVVIGRTRVSIGKRRPGRECDDDYISKR